MSEVFLYSDINRAVSDCMSELERLKDDRGYSVDTITEALTEQGYDDLADGFIRWQSA